MKILYTLLAFLGISLNLHCMDNKIAVSKPVRDKSDPKYLIISAYKTDVSETDPAGLLVYSELDKDTVALESLDVEPKFRGHGIGKILFLSLKDLLKKQGFKKIIWEAKTDDYEYDSEEEFDGQQTASLKLAEGFYEKLGGTILEDTEGGYEMERRISHVQEEQPPAKKRRKAVHQENVILPDSE